MFNPDFNSGEFATIRSQAGLNSYKISVKEWVQKTNIRDHAALEQLVVLTNLESLNSVLIRQGLPQPERLATLNDIAITQLRALLAASSAKRLESSSSLNTEN